LIGRYAVTHQSSGSCFGHIANVRRFHSWRHIRLFRGQNCISYIYMYPVRFEHLTLGTADGWSEYGGFC
jgi:hypothetical protein